MVTAGSPTIFSYEKQKKIVPATFFLVHGGTQGKDAPFSTFFFHFQSYWLLFWGRLVLGSWLLLRMHLPLASLASLLR